MGRLKGIKVILVSKIESGKDPFGNAIYDKKNIEVNNVLIGQPTTDDITNSLNLYGKKAVYTLAIPKGDTNIWENQEVIFFGQKWRVFGKVTQGIENLVPLSWNKKVMVESYE
ncbi:hypothetical protein [Peptoanaerobacter stomatis]|uniref:hypothetical protein n=1 Tax=Peptoanaerobacter stomatis TaxID=796937 RepID=UPI003F9EBEDB